MMANETQSLKMLSHYNASYVLVFPVLQLQISSSGSLDGVKFAGYGDEGKWFWMARISGEAVSRLMTDETFGIQWMNSQYSWTNETSFGNTTTDSTGAQSFQWNEMGLNSTIYKLMSDAARQWELRNGVTSTDQVADAPSYFTAEFISGLEIDPTTAYQLWRINPLVALYRIDWTAYAATNSATP
jgi:hypothetical protein